MAVLLITHDLNLVRHFAERVAVMENGLLVESGHGRSGLRVAAASLYARLMRAGRSARCVPVLPTVARAARRAATSPSTTRRSCRASRLVPASGAFEAVRRVSVSVRQGETLGIVGESGSGKSTLAHGAARPAAHSHGDGRVPGHARSRD